MYNPATQSSYEGVVGGRRAAPTTFTKAATTACNAPAAPAAAQTTDPVEAPMASRAPEGFEVCLLAMG